MSILEPQVIMLYIMDAHKNPKRFTLPYQYKIVGDKPVVSSEYNEPCECSFCQKKQSDFNGYY